MSHDRYDLKEALQVEWDGSSREYDAQHAHGIQTAEERQAWTQLFRDMNLQVPLDVLDVGCGTGEMSMVLGEMGHRVTGIDLSTGMLEIARRKASRKGYPISFLHGDAEALTFADHSFDLVINRHLLWTLPDPGKALGEWRRILRPGGTLAVIDGLWRDGSMAERVRRVAGNIGVLLTEHKNLFGGYYTPDMIRALPHPYGMTAEVAENYVRSAGFDAVQTHSMNRIMAIQLKYMPVSRRIAYHKTYFLVTGIKPSYHEDADKGDQ